jgi:hypothetical protein
MKILRASDVVGAIVVAILCMPVMKAIAQDKPKAAAGDEVKALSAKPTPKAADGHPDLSGRWIPADGGRRGNNGGRVEGNVHDLYFGEPIPGADPERDAITTRYGDTTIGGGTGEDKRKAREAQNKPVYKPEFQAKVEANGKDPNHNDPTQYSCLPSGVPRMGPPAQIVQSYPGLIILLYASYSSAISSGPANPYSTYRVVPTDGRAHRQGDDYDATPYGDPVGHWEGDTLVIDTTGFDDSTWIGQDGYFHTDAMRVIERFKRKGDTLEYSATVEDPKVLAKPFNMNPVMRKLGGPNDILYNYDYPCDIGVHSFREHADHENHL